MISGHANIEMAINSLKHGAFEFVEKPFDQNRLLNFIKRAVENLNLKTQNKDYEKAAIYRDRISALRDIQRSQSIAGFKRSRDAIYISSQGRQIKIGVTSVNQGWVTGHKNFLQIEGLEEKNILSNFSISNINL